MIRFNSASSFLIYLFSCSPSFLIAWLAYTLLLLLCETPPPHPPRTTTTTTMVTTSAERKAIDDKLSNRDLDLDPEGYFLISIDKEAGEIVVKHYGNTINEAGQAVDPETGEIIPCEGGTKRPPHKIYRGKTAKEVGVALVEGSGYHPVSKLDHALYLGRELQKAERCLEEGTDYQQD